MATYATRIIPISVSPADWIAEIKQWLNDHGSVSDHDPPPLPWRTISHGCPRCNYNAAQLISKALEDVEGIGSIPASERLYQFRITLLKTNPLIWRRIQVKESTLDKLHERIQTSVGWTNSHLHKSRLGSQPTSEPTSHQSPKTSFGRKWSGAC